jgi:hypothetical protein
MKVICFPENSASFSAGRSIPGLQASGLKFNMELSFDLRNNDFDVRKSFSAVWEHAGTHYSSNLKKYGSLKYKPPQL